MSEHNEHGSCSCEEPPDEPDEGPLDYEEIDEFISGIEDPRIKGFLRLRLAEHRQMCEQLAYWEGLEREHRYGVAVGGEQRPDDCNLFLRYTSAEKAREAASGDRATAYVRTLALPPWERLDDSPF